MISNIKRLLAIAILLFAPLACKKSTPKLAGVTDQHATLICLSEAGDLVDFVRVTPETDIKRIEFLAPSGGETIHVLAVGPAVSPVISPEMVVSSKVAQGYFGKVTAKIDDGMVTTISGNGIAYETRLTLAHLEEIQKQLSAGKNARESTRIIFQDRYLRDLITDADGNQTPRDISNAHREFLDLVISSLRKGKPEALHSLIHMDGDRTDDKWINADFLAFAASRRIDHYRFMRFDPDHPDNTSETKHRHSLPVVWKLTVYFNPPDSYVSESADLLIGDDQGQLKFPTAYAE